VITQAGDLPNVAGLVYVAAFAPDAGERLGQISDWRAAEAPSAGNVAPDSDGYVWIKQDKFRESLCQDLPADEALVMALPARRPGCGPGSCGCDAPARSGNTHTSTNCASNRQAPGRSPYADHAVAGRKEAARRLAGVRT
jgi:hypothetical protein